MCKPHMRHMCKPVCAHEAFCFHQFTFWWCVFQTCSEICVRLGIWHTTYATPYICDTLYMRHPTYVNNTGTSWMHVSGAWNGDQSILYGNCSGTYASFPSDLKHRSVPIRHHKRILKIAFFFRIFPRKYAVVRQPKRAREATVPTRTSTRQRTDST